MGSAVVSVVASIINAVLHAEGPGPHVGVIRVYLALALAGLTSPHVAHGVVTYEGFHPYAIARAAEIVAPEVVAVSVTGSLGLVGGRIV